MLDIKLNWFFFHLGTFLLLLVLLNYILFRPLLSVITKRKNHIKGDIDSAKEMDGEKENILRQIETTLVEARAKAGTIFEDISKEGLAVHQESLDSAKKEAAEINTRAKENIEADVKKARKSLRGKIKSFSKIIIEKMVGV